MDVVGVDVVLARAAPACRAPAARAACRLRGPARRCRECAGCAARTPARPSQRTARSASTRRCARGVSGRTARVSRTARAAAIAIDAAGRAIDQRTGQAAAPQRPHQGGGARIAPPGAAVHARRRRQVQHAGRQAGQAAQAGGLVEVGHHRREPGSAQCGDALGRRGQRQQPHPAAQQARGAQPDVAAADDQHALAPKARRQRAEGAMVCGQNSFLFHLSPKNTHECRRVRRELSITVEPSGRQFAAQGDETILAAAIRQGIGLPYGCKDGACGSCKCKKLSGEVAIGAHQSKALSAEEQINGYVLTCCAYAQSDVVLESRQVTEAGAFPIRKMPVRVQALTRQSHDVMVIKPADAGGRAAAVPCRPVHRIHPAGRRAPQLLDGQRAAHAGRAGHRARTARAPHARRPLHRPRVRRHEGKGNPAHRRPLRQLLPARGLRQADRAAGVRHRLRADQGADRAHELARASTGRPRCTGAGAGPKTCTWTTGCASALGRACRTCATCRWCRTRCRKTTGLAAPASSTAPCWRTSPDLSGYQVYACGAPIVVDSARARLRGTRAGLPDEEFFADAFTTEADKAGP